MRILVLALLLQFPQEPQRDMNTIVEHGVQIHIVMGPNEGSGSGVFIENDLILTANHLYTEGARYYIDPDHLVEVDVVKRDELHDLMLLRAKGKNKKASLGNQPKRLDEVFVMGYPKGNAEVIVVGRVADTTNEKLLIDATVLHGMSGGGVYNKNGKLVGLCVMAWGDEDKQVFMVAISINEIRKFIK